MGGMVADDLLPDSACLQRESRIQTTGSLPAPSFSMCLCLDHKSEMMPPAQSHRPAGFSSRFLFLVGEFGSVVMIVFSAATLWKFISRLCFSDAHPPFPAAISSINRLMCGFSVRTNSQRLYINSPPTHWSGSRLYYCMYQNCLIKTSFCAVIIWSYVGI